MADCGMRCSLRFPPTQTILGFCAEVCEVPANLLTLHSLLLMLLTCHWQSQDFGRGDCSYLKGRQYFTVKSNTNQHETPDKSCAQHHPAATEINGSCKAKFPIISCKSQLELVLSASLLCAARAPTLVLHGKRALQQPVKFMMRRKQLELNCELFVTATRSHSGARQGPVAVREKQRKSSRVFSHSQNMQSWFGVRQ